MPPMHSGRGNAIETSGILAELTVVASCLWAENLEWITWIYAEMAKQKLSQEDVIGLLFADSDSEGEDMPSEDDDLSFSDPISR